ncbi:MAG: tetratricopeptide repeat protein [Aggregatilineales bacterium]
MIAFNARRLGAALCFTALLALAGSLRAEESAPEAVSLTGLRLVWQQYNRCAAAALAIHLSYFESWQGSYDQVIAALNPHEEDVSVRMDEMAAYARAQGLSALVRTGGTLETVRALINAGFPLLVENVHYEGPNDWMSHNWVLMGYDDAAGVVLAYDPRLGAGPNGLGRPMPYAEFEAGWKPFGRNYLLLFEPANAARVQAALGDHWDAAANAEWTLAQAQAEIAADPDDAFALFNAGTALVTLERYAEAAPLFDRALEIGLPWRMLWYQYGPFEAYLRTGRYDGALALVERVLRTTPGVEEMYYYAGRAYEGLGNVERAAANYRAALWRNRYYAEAEAALAALTGE